MENQTPPESKPSEKLTVSTTGPAKKKSIENNLKLLLMLAAIYSLIINQTRKKDFYPVKKADNLKKEELSAGKNKDELVQNASFLLYK